ncbi:MAG: GNAT family N-acetyltransferase [Eubacteriales bacterium]|nr:GNAT family N-acetyltransferase [Eubacteriales bacterium]
MIHQVTDMRRIAPLYETCDDYLCLSTLDGCMGRAWANEAETAAQVVNGDFCMLAGDPEAEGARELILHIPPEHKGDELFICSLGDRWNAAIESAWGETAHAFDRYAILKEPDVFDREKLKAMTAPEGYRIVPIDGALYRECLLHDWSRDFVSQFQDEADYAARGLGVAALKDGELVAGASSYVVFHGGIEIEIDTRTDHRRRGLARACGAALILACLERGLYPSWDAANPESVALSQQLGYHPGEAYRTYSVPHQRAESAPEINRA